MVTPLDKTHGKLYVVGTPIGNLEDIGTRALNVLTEVDVIACEDTRVTAKLLNHYGIETKLVSYHAQSDEKKLKEVLGVLLGGSDVALVSDAGTPTISDPGSRLVFAAHEAGVPVIAIPGPSAVAAALSISGLPSSDFLFLGFLPHKKGRQTLLKEIAASERTVVFYESPHRILKALEELKGVLSPERTVVVARELTKIYEEVVRGSAEELSAYFETNPDKVRGEFVVMVSGGKG